MHHLNLRQVWFDAIKKPGDAVLGRPREADFLQAWMCFVPVVSKIREGSDGRFFPFLRNLKPPFGWELWQSLSATFHGSRRNFSPLLLSTSVKSAHKPQELGEGRRERGEITQALPPQKQPERGVCSSVWPKRHPKIVKYILKCLNYSGRRMLLIFMDEESSDQEFSSSENLDFAALSPTISQKISCLPRNSD